MQQVVCTAIQQIYAGLIRKCSHFLQRCPSELNTSRTVSTMEGLESQDQDQKHQDREYNPRDGDRDQKP